ncbi:NAPDH-dependent diflavin reductase NDAI_0A07720 [Naumovozyma dairenensis CBS 421]|uniref:NADPH-dependent diflavin oxidoreductase 1 n=1 Tax=Naumovozyma dairenensis (strain ATCC 10597 / BCRC 20456 / CBS 421 / NBRC 0211 / NRRL Y-12639) TaxID=1071378 RepID=G0W538_NAUDC|nr:hypothetical protein NDAI_0A07720 [Naumovozyma dairenensis CBS 421]CCD22926.1 hypothetical protein NDAI_0A07720 [Naumovozyma dairenensis CBS 421]
MSSQKKIAILFGSETGNAQDFATILSHKLQRLHFSHTLSSFSEYDPKDILSCKYLFLFCSTTGQGELPKNASDGKFWSFLKKKKLPANFLSHVNVTLFGLGDSSYPKFNYAIRKLHQRIVVQLGAKEVFDRLEADEQSMAGSNKGTGAGVESVYFEYEKRILQFLKEKFPNRKLKNGEVIERDEIDPEIYLAPYSYLTLADEEDDPNPAASDNSNIKFEGDKSMKYGKVIKNERITDPEHFQDVRQFIFKNNDESVNDIYYPGDTAAIYSYNTDLAVEQFLENQSHWLEVADKPLKFTNGIPSHLRDGGIVKPLTIRNLLKYHCDIMSIPRTSFFMKMWTFATDVTRMERGEEQLNDQRDKLKEFAYDEDMQELYDYCNRPRRSILEVLDDFLSVRLPWKYMLDYLPIIKPRYYSISSGPCNPQIELTVAIVKYRTILRKIRKGVCSDFIAHLNTNDQVRYKIISNNLIRKSYHGKPMILVSPGVGIAPLMSVVKANVSNDIHFFFGCRFKDKDYLYQDILEKWNSENKIMLHPVFSRDRENSPDTKYVQDVLWKLGQEMTDLIVKDNALMLLCGASGKMPVQVRLTVIEMLKKWGNFADDDAARKYLKEMERDDRYLQETW